MNTIPEIKTKSMAEQAIHLAEPIEAVIFDCDGTLSQLEGINELAKVNGVQEQVEQLTDQAMSHTGLNPDLYAQRLALVRPTLSQVTELGYQYFANLTPDTLNVIKRLQFLGKMIYIISAGVNPAVQMLGEQLGVPTRQIYAVNLNFNEIGDYLSFDNTSPLINNDGKYHLVKALQQQYKRMAYIGDGLNDYSVYDLVTRFIGYGGVFYREKMAKLCQYYLTRPSMSALLPLVLTTNEWQSVLTN